MLPTLRQGRLVVWDGITRDGKRVMDAWPEQVIAHKRNDEMKLQLVNGSQWQVVGSDNYNSLVGSNPIGVVFSEWSLTDPAAWEFVRPILAENGGWAMFIYTPRGRNHGHRMLQIAEREEDWFAETLTVDDTHAIDAEAIEAERRGGMSEPMIQQEFYCSFSAPLVGAYYAAQLTQARKDGRITEVPYDPAVGVETIWDLGIGDATAIIFAQRVGRAIHVIDYYENSGEGLAHYAGVVKNKPYVYDRHLVPHDAEARELGTGKSRREVLANHGLATELVPRLGVDDGIEAGRNLLSKAYIDARKCDRLVDALAQYRAEEDQRHGDGVTPMLKRKPRHDWTSHPADAWRYLAVSDEPVKDWGGALTVNIGTVV